MQPEARNGISVPSTPKPPFWVRYPLRANPLKSSISPLFTSSKITTIPPKILSKPYKIRLQSNSTENTIFNKEITHQKPSIYNSSIIQNTSKINTFHYTQSANNIHLSKSYFLSLTPYQKFTSTHQDHTTHQSQSTKQHPHPTFLTCNHWIKSKKIDSNFNQNHFNDKILT